MMKRSFFVIGLILAIGIGLLIARIDSRPGWDDSGISAGMVLLATAAFGALFPQRPWLWALAIGAWIPLFAIFQSQNYGSLLALAIALVGAYGGALARRALTALSRSS
jgi:hypothetical protein